MMNIVKKTNLGYKKEKDYFDFNHRKNYVSRTIDIRSTVKDFVSNEGKNVVSKETGKNTTIHQF